MRISTIKRHIREGFKNIYRNGWMTAASIGAVTVTLVLVGAFLALILNLNKMASNIEEDVEIKVLIDLMAEENEIKMLGDQIADISGVDDIRFSSNTDELQEIVSSMGEDGEAWLLYEDDNPLNHAYIVNAEKPQDTERIATEIENLANVQKVNYGKDHVDRLFQLTKHARNIGLVLIIGLLLTAIFLISNTIKLTIMARSTEIGIMKLVGATNWFIRWPFFIEGMLLGMLGAVIPIALILTGYLYIYKYVSERASFAFIELLPYDPFAWQLSLLMLAIGTLIGMWGSVMSVRKFLKI